MLAGGDVGVVFDMALNFADLVRFELAFAVAFGCGAWRRTSFGGEGGARHTSLNMNFVAGLDICSGTTTMARMN